MIDELSNLHDTLAYFKRQAAKGHTAFASRLSEIEAQIATLEADILSVYPTAPVVEAAQPDDGCPLCGGDGINKAGSASCPACNGSGYANEPALEATAQNDDIVARLEDAAEVYNDYACDCNTDLYQEAADEIRRLRAEVDALLNGEPVISVRYDADYEPAPWVWNVRRMERSIQNNAKTRELAEQYANQIAESIRRQNQR